MSTFLSGDLGWGRVGRIVVCVCISCLEGGWGENMNQDKRVWGDPVGLCLRYGVVWHNKNV